MDRKFPVFNTIPCVIGELAVNVSGLATYVYENHRSTLQDFQIEVVVSMKHGVVPWTLFDAETRASIEAELKLWLLEEGIQRKRAYDELDDYADGLYRQRCEELGI